jgi:two-component sensor histidine kinase
MTETRSVIALSINKEVHHRVKNNLTIIQNLLALQLTKAADSAARHARDDSQARIRAIAMNHAQLYRSNDLSHIEFADYIGSLANELHANYQALNDNISLRIAIPVIAVAVDTIIPCGRIRHN